MARKNRRLTKELTAARARIDTWRKEQGGRRRIPDEYWNLASKLARTHGVYRVGQAMRLHTGRIRERMAEGPATQPLPVNESAFVELKPPAQPSGQCTVEVFNDDGARMTIRTRSSAEVAALVRAFTARPR